MGNNPKFQLLTDEPLVAGNSLTGTLVIKAKYDAWPSDGSFKVTFTGQEKVKIILREGNSSGTTTETAKTLRKLIHVEPNVGEINSIIRQNNGYLPAGTYQVPLNIPLPPDLPGAFMVKYRHHSYAIVSYEFKVVDGWGIEQFKEFLPIRARPKPLQIQPRIVAAKSHGVTRMLLQDRGQVTLGAQADDSILIPGQEVTVDLGIVNDSKANIKDIAVTLVEKVVWTHPAYQDPIYYEHKVKKNLIESKILETNEHCDRKDSKELLNNPRKSPQINQRLVAEQLSSGDLSVKLPPVPDDAFDSYSSDWIKVEHNIKVVFGTKKLTSNPGFKIPVRIQRGPPAASEAAVATEDIPIAQATKDIPIAQAVVVGGSEK